MTIVSRGEINAALKDLLGLRGNVALRLDETVLPVVVLGDLREDASKYPIGWHGHATATSAGGGTRTWVVLDLPATAQCVVSVEYIEARTYGAGQFAQLWVGDDTDEPAPAGVGLPPLELRARPKALGAPRWIETPLRIAHGPLTAPANFGRQIGFRITEVVATQEVVWDTHSPPIWLLPGSWLGVKNGANDLSLDALLRGRLWPLA